MAVSSEGFAGYRDDLKALTTLAKDATRALTGLLAGLEGEEFVEALRRYYPVLCKQYGDEAASLAVGFYDAERERAGVENPFTALSEGNDWIYDICSDDVSEALSQSRRRDGSIDRDRVGDNLGARNARHAMERAEATIITNARRDPAHPKWAIVPNPRACGWCVMIGSRGFEYTSKGTALSQRHANCTCTPVVDFDRDNPALEGYDPGKLYRQYSACRQAVEWDLKRRWDEMGPMERGGRTFEEFRRDEIVAEMNRRDRDWLQTGVPPEVAYEKPREQLTDEERKTVDALQANGFRIVVRLEDGNARANIDLEVGPDNALWEMKNVGNGNHAVEDRMRDSYHKWTRLGLDPTEARTVLSSFGATREEALILADMLARMRYAREALYVTRGGGVRRIIKR